MFTIPTGMLKKKSTSPPPTPPVFNTWFQKTPVTSPSSRIAMGMAFDVARGNAIMFGGTTNGFSAISSETWKWDGTDWTNVNPATTPPARFGHVMEYDSVRQKIVMWGGFDAGFVLASRVWEWDGTDWTEVVTSGSAPPVSVWSDGAYDSVRQRLVVWPGQTGAGASQETFEYDGATATWTNPSSSHPAGNEYGISMVFDAAVGLAVMHRAGNPGTYTWDGSSWTGVSNTVRPSGTRFMGIAFDSDRDVTLSMGGEGDTDQTHEWSGSDWTLKSPTTSPSSRAAHGMCYDPVRQQMVLFGGGSNGNTTGGGGGGLNNETWVTSP